MIPYSFHPEADAELEEATLFYESRLVGLGKSFAAEVERMVSLIREFPDAGAKVGIDRRRVVVDRFPYSIVYRRDPASIVIVAVAHQRRRTRYWRNRN